MRVSTLVLCLLLCFVVSACQLTGSKESQVVRLVVGFSDRDSLSFEGKGAGAGMMLMSSMGPMGVAIGVAIDEGIAKEIEESMSAESYEINALILNSLKKQLASNQVIIVVEPTSERMSNEIIVTIDDYGFKLGSGDNDPAYANIALTIEQSGLKNSFHFPDDFELKANELRTVELENLKIDGHKSAELIQISLDKIFAVWRDTKQK